jgi:hypothetical protein
MEFNDIYVPESKKDQSWIERLIQYYRLIATDSEYGRQVDQKCWKYYNNQLPSDRFDYFLKIGNYDLPAQPRHIPLQRHLIDVLVSQQTKRPFISTVMCTDSRSVKERQTLMVKSVISDLMAMVEQNIFKNEAQVQQLQEQLAMIEQQLQVQPQSQEEAMQIQKLKQAYPQIRAQLSFVQGQIARSSDDLQEKLQELERYYTYDWQDWKEAAAQKRLVHLYKKHKIKSKSKTAFLHKAVTGKQFYYVNLKPGQRTPDYEVIDSSMVTFPVIDGVQRVQNGPWVKLTSYNSYQAIVEQYGDEIESKYGEEALKGLATAFYASTSAQKQWSSTPAGDVFLGNYSPYAGTNEVAQGIIVEEIWVRVPRKIKTKYSPNPYKQDEVFRHFLTSGKVMIDETEWRYDSKKSAYIKKDNPAIIKPKTEVETYNSSKGQKIKTFFLSDIYQGVVIDGKYIVCEGLMPYALRHPDDWNDIKLPIFGRTFSSVSEKPYSLIWTTKDIQELYDIIHTQKELMIALAGTKTIFYDKGQKPGDLKQDEFFYQMKKGIAYVETITPEGQRVQSTFNQWAMVDLSLSPAIQYLDLMSKSLEETMGNIIGVPRPAQGQVVNSDQVGTYMESINRAMLITEVLYFDHDEIEAEALTQLLNLDLNFCMDNGDVFEVLGKDFGREIVTILPKMFEGTYTEIIVGDHSEEKKKIARLEELASLGFKTGNIPFENLLDIFQSDSVVELAKKVQYFTKQARKLAAQARDAEHRNEMELEQAKVQFANEFEGYWNEQANKIEQAKLILEEKKAQIDADLAYRAQKLNETLGLLDRNMKAMELANEQDSENRAADINERNNNVNAQLQTLKLQVETMLSFLQLGIQEKGQLIKGVTDMKKIEVDKIKARKMTKEHVSDR